MYPAVSRLRVCGEWRLPRLGKVFNVVISSCFPSERWSLFCSWLLVSQIIVTLYRHPFVDSISNLPCPLYCIAWLFTTLFCFDYSLAARSALIIDYLAHWPFLPNKDYDFEISLVLRLAPLESVTYRQFTEYRQFHADSINNAIFCFSEPRLFNIDSPCS